MSAGTLAAARLQQRLAARRGPGLDDLQLEQRRRPDDLLGALHVGHARQLHQDLVGAAPCAATIGSATPSSLTRRSIVCSACVTASSRSVPLDVRLHREACRCRRRRTRGCRSCSISVAELPEQRVLRLGHAGDRNRRRAVRRGGRRRRCSAVVKLLAQPLGSSASRLDPQRIVGLHAHDEVHAALEVEAEANRLLQRVERPHRRAPTTARMARSFQWRFLFMRLSHASMRALSGALRHDRLLALEAADGRLRHVDAHVVGDLQLHATRRSSSRSSRRCRRS